MDPLTNLYTWQSPYAYIRNNPIFFVDVNGEGDPLAEMKIRQNQASHLFGKVRTQNGVQNSKNQQGFDYYAPSGTPISAVMDAEVVSIVTNDRGDYGKQIVLKIVADDDANTVYYAFYVHLSEINVQVCDKAAAGKEIGKSGNTGNASTMTGDDQHLHFELRTIQSPGLGLTGRENPNNIVTNKFYSQDPDANTNQTNTGVVKVDINATATKQDKNGTETVLNNYTPDSNVTNTTVTNTTTEGDKKEEGSK